MRKKLNGKINIRGFSNKNNLIKIIKWKQDQEKLLQQKMIWIL